VGGPWGGGTLRAAGAIPAGLAHHAAFAAFALLANGAALTALALRAGDAAILEGYDFAFERDNARLDISLH